MSPDSTSLFHIALTESWCRFSVVRIKSSTERFKTLVKSLNLEETSSQKTLGSFSTYFSMYLEEIKISGSLRDIIEVYEERIRNITKLWIKDVYSKEERFSSPDDWENTPGGLFLGLRSQREINRKRFPARASEHLIDYTLLKDFWPIWKKDMPWFENAVALSSPAILERISYIAEKRNPPAHGNISFLSHSEVNLTQNYCKEMIAKIDAALDRMS